MPHAPGKAPIDRPHRSRARVRSYVRPAGRRSSVAAVLITVAAAFAGCGGSGEVFTSAEADRAMSSLDSIESAVAEGRCDAARSRANSLVGQARTVNGDRPDLGAAFAESVAHLQQLIDTECRDEKTEPTEQVTAETGETGESAPAPTEAEPQPTPQPEPTGTEPTTPPPEPAPPADDQSGGVSPE